MEVNELITALNVCADDDIICLACERYDEECDGSWTGPAFLMAEAAKALEGQQKRIAELEAEKRWIPVTERLPDKSGYFLAVNNGWQIVCHYSAEHQLFNAYDGFSDREAMELHMDCTHWMPLPEPPKEALDESYPN